MNELQTTLVNVTLPEGVKIKETDSRIYIIGATKENPVINHDYPWGRKFRTDQAYWIEKKNNKFRLVYKTRNPKTGRWCAEKKMTYSDYTMLVILKENEHVKTTGFNWYDREKAQAFIRKFEDFIAPEDIKHMKALVKIDEAISEQWKKAEEISKKKIEEATPIDLTSKLLWEENELRYTPETLTTYRVYLSTYGTKKRCRKKTSNCITLGYVGINSEVENLSHRLKDKIKEVLTGTYRELDKVNLELQKTTIEGRSADSPHFQSFTSSLMTCDYRESLDLEKFFKAA